MASLPVVLLSIPARVAGLPVAGLCGMALLELSAACLSPAERQLTALTSIFQ